MQLKVVWDYHVRGLHIQIDSLKGQLSGWNRLCLRQDDSQYAVLVRNLPGRIIYILWQRNGALETAISALH